MNVSLAFRTRRQERPEPTPSTALATALLEKLDPAMSRDAKRRAIRDLLIERGVKPYVAKQVARTVAK